MLVISVDIWVANMKYQTRALGCPADSNPISWFMAETKKLNLGVEDISHNFEEERNKLRR